MEFYGKMLHGQSMTVGFSLNTCRDVQVLTVKVSDRKRNLSEQQEKSNFSVLVPPGKSMRMEVNDVDRLGKFEVNVAEKEEAGVAVGAFSLPRPSNYVCLDVCQTSRFHLVLSETEKFTFFVSGSNDKKPREFYLRKDDDKKEYTVEMVKKAYNKCRNWVHYEDLHAFCKSANTREELEDSRTLASYGILQKALFEMRIVEPERYIGVKHDTGNLRLVIEEAVTIGSIKIKLKERLDVPIEEQRLLSYAKSGGEWMDDDARTLASYGIPNKEYIRMSRYENRKLTISVRCMFKKTFKIEVFSVETVGNLKEKIQEEKGYAVDKQILRFGEKVLENEKKVAFYDIDSPCKENPNNIFLSFR